MACTTCAQNKPGNQPPASLLQPLPTPTWPKSHMALDLITNLPSSAGYNTILTIVDCFSEAAHFVLLPKLLSTMETTQLDTTPFRLHGIPEDIVSDCEPQFTSRVWKEFCSALGAKVRHSSGYHPQSNRQMQCTNQELEAALPCVAATNHPVWSEQLPWVEYVHNSLTSSVTGLSLFEASLGFQPLLFPALEGEHSVPCAQCHLRRCSRVWRECYYALRSARSVCQTKTGLPLLNMPSVKRYGSPLASFLCVLNLKKLTPNFVSLSEIKAGLCSPETSSKYENP